LAKGSTITYTNAASWLAAARALPNVKISAQTLANNRLNPSGVTIASYSGLNSQNTGNGKIHYGEWDDCVGKSACSGLLYDTTKLSSARPMYAFAGTWNLNGATPGGLEIYIDGNSQPLSPNRYQNGRNLAGRAYAGFFGFVSDTPFESITLGSSGSQSFTLTNI
jgi:hypothetical protein